jgi:hypothetical protein
VKNTSVKHRRISSEVDEEQDYFDNLIRVERKKYTPGPTGNRLHMSLARTKIVRGGLGSGKSRAACEHVNNLALVYPKSTHVIGRKDMTSLKETTQKEFLEKVVDSATIEAYNVNDNKLTYKNGSEVLFRETKEPDKFKSLELTSYLIDEADENQTPEMWEKLDERLRQKWETGVFRDDGTPEYFYPPYSGMLVFNPVNEEHWLYGLAQRKDIDIEDFKFTTYENEKNLPPDYIPNLLKKLAPWEVERLVHGAWGRVVRGNPVYHGFRRESHVREIKALGHLPLLVGWDFGYNHPALSFCQLDAVTGRLFILREHIGTNESLQDGPDKPGTVTQYRKIMRDLIGDTYWPVFHYGDPHGNDKKDVGESSIEYLRNHHNIHVLTKRELIRTGRDEIQHKITTRAPVNPAMAEMGLLPLLVVDYSCKNLILGFEGGYHRDPEGKPVKDGLYDHGQDTLRYVVTNTMGAHLKTRYRDNRYKPRNKITGY